MRKRGRIFTGTSKWLQRPGWMWIRMASLAENNLKFQASVQALIKKFESLKVSVTEVR